MVENFLKFLEFEKRYSKHTITAYQKDLQQLQAFLETTFEIGNPAEIKHPHLRSWIVQLMEDGILPKSINRKIATLKSYFKFLLGRDYIKSNPATRLKPLKTGRQLPEFIKETEMTTLLDQIEFDASFSGIRDKIIIELLYTTGIRLSEIIGLRESSINPHEHVIKVLGKRNKERIIPYPSSLQKDLENYQDSKVSLFGHTESYLVTDSGTVLYPMFVYRLIKKYLSMVTTQSKKSPHVLRHSFATHLLNKGADLNAVKDLLGHTSLAATQVYTHNSMEKLKTAFDKAHPKA